MALSKKRASTRALVAFCDYVIRHGGRVSEMPPYATVTRGAHSSKSFHYDKDGKYGQAADINFGAAGSSAAERAAIAAMIPVAESMGLAVLHSLHGHVAGHDSHLHVDVGSFSNLGRGLYTPPKGSLVVWDTQPIIHTKQDNLNGPLTDKQLEAIKAASNRHGVRFPYGVAFTQRAVGAKDDDEWGPKSRKCHDNTVNALQKVWKPAGLYTGAYDTIWGALMDKAFAAFKKL